MTKLILKFSPTFYGAKTKELSELKSVIMTRLSKPDFLGLPTYTFYIDYFKRLTNKLESSIIENNELTKQLIETEVALKELTSISKLTDKELTRENKKMRKNPYAN
jgi:hypothetical protein